MLQTHKLEQLIIEHNEQHHCRKILLALSAFF